MRVLVTGGAGYIGSGLVMELVKNPHISEVVIYDNLSRGHLGLFVGTHKLEDARVRFVHGDILDGRKLSASMTNMDVVYHLAGNVTSPYADQNPQQFEQVNHWGTAEVVRAIEKSDVKRLIYLSTVSVYGWSDAELTTQSPLNPNTYYGVSKMRGEEQISCISGNVETFVIRCANVFGYSPSMRKDTVVNSFMFNANFLNRIKIIGSGTQKRVFVSISQVVQELSALVNSATIIPGIYNLVGHTLSIRELADEVKNLYPDLETITVNQHLTMRQVLVAKSPEMQQYGVKSFQDELREFREKFTFHAHQS
jgi:UDP-glucose 4-epimerase